MCLQQAVGRGAGEIVERVRGAVSVARNSSGEER